MFEENTNVAIMHTLMMRVVIVFIFFVVWGSKPNRVSVDCDFDNKHNIGLRKMQAFSPVFLRSVAVKRRNYPGKTVKLPCSLARFYPQI